MRHEPEHNAELSIPNWKTVKLGEVTEIIKGGTPSRNVEKYFRGNIAWAIPSDITALDSFLYIDDTETHITEEALSNSAARLLPAGTVLLTSRATIGETAITTVPMATNQGFANFVCKEKLLNVFLAYYLRYIKGKLNDLASGSTFKEVTKGTLLNIEIPCLPLEEQRAIAEVLSDVDGLIDALEALIAKKQAIKQATMQQLLTGKTRLPGFSGEWKTKRLGEIAHIKTGGRNNEDKVEDGQYSFFVRSPIVERINSYCYDGEAILVPGEGGIESIFHYINGRFDCHQRVYMINRFVKDVYGKLVYYIMVLQFGSHAMQNTVKATVDSLRLPTFKNFSFSIPTDIAEQHAIAFVLSDMDAEIAALEQRRDKTRAIKQGMMQQLLTGRVRLVKPNKISNRSRKQEPK